MWFDIDAESTMDQVIETLMWQGTASNEAGECMGCVEDYEIQLTDEDREHVLEIWQGFVNVINPMMTFADRLIGGDGVDRWRDHTNIAHDWVLNQNHHGTGFWYRYYGDQPLARFGDWLSDTSALHTLNDIMFFVEKDGEPVMIIL